jgi:CRISPR/Cas system-associated endoribonuclease Cas2
MNTANEILESLDAAEIRQRLETLDKERQALLILYRAAIRLERQANAAGLKKDNCERGKP